MVASLLFLNWEAAVLGQPVRDVEISLRKVAVKEFKSVARQRFETDIGSCFGYSLIRMHLESSYLPGDDADTVFHLSGLSISGYIDLGRRLGSLSISGYIDLGRRLGKLPTTAL